MHLKLDQLTQEAVLGQSLLSILLKATFIALVSFGAPAGVLAAFAPRFFFGLTEGITCPRGTEMIYDEWYDGESNQFRVGCLEPGGSEVQGRTLLALLVYLAMWFIGIFYIAFSILLIRRSLLKRRYGVGA